MLSVCRKSFPLQGRRFVRAMSMDLRSDTVTMPSLEMREVMAKAKVGDDVYGEDPTVRRLQRLVARMLNKEAALFLPTGTQSNLVAVGTHCGRGEEIILGRNSHIYVYEGGGASAYMGVSMNLVPNNADGSFDLELLRKGIRPLNDSHYPITKAVALENTHNVCGGTILPQTFVHDVRKICDENNLALHLDGARLWNASVATGMSMSELCEHFDTVSVCLSKGLGAPVGSVLVGSKKFIARAHRLRKSLGGGMRQAGILAAAGIYAIENNFPRLGQDHERAKSLASVLQSYPNVFTNITEPQTNIIFFEVTGNRGKLFTDELRKRGVFMGSYGVSRVRAVTHIDVSDEDLARILEIIHEIARKL